MLVTSMERKNGIEADTLAGYPQNCAGRGAKDGVALIDCSVSKVLYRALGESRQGVSGWNASQQLRQL